MELLIRMALVYNMAQAQKTPQQRREEYDTHQSNTLCWLVAVLVAVGYIVFNIDELGYAFGLSIFIPLALNLFVLVMTYDWDGDHQPW